MKSEGRPQRIAIIGGGFSGAMVLANLVEQANAPLAIDMYDASGQFASGIAYGTDEPAYLLNVRADRMGAFAGKPEGFYAWLCTQEGSAHAKTLCPHLVIAPDAYFPRMLYGQYVQQLFNAALAMAKNKQIAIGLHAAEVIHVDATTPLQLTVKHDNSSYNATADALVLATGNLPPRRFGFHDALRQAAAPVYVDNVWHAGEASVFPAQVAQLPATATVFIIGTGLTMVDTVINLVKHGYKGHIIAVSRRGHVPAGHLTATGNAWKWTVQPQAATALGLLRWLRQELAQARAQSVNWRNVIDALRPHTQTLWQGLPVAQRRRFMRHLLSLWNSHRHRMAPDIHAQIDALMDNGKLEIIAGSMLDARAQGQGIQVSFRRRGATQHETVQAALLLNCTGPELGVTHSPSALLKQLAKDGLITPHALKAGIAITDQRTAVGNAPAQIYPIGTLCVSELLECTAVPELREQASQLAATLLARGRLAQMRALH